MYNILYAYEKRRGTEKVEKKSVMKTHSIKKHKSNKTPLISIFIIHDELECALVQ